MTGATFYELKKRKIFEKSLIRGPTKIARRDLVTFKFEPHGFQRYPKALFAHPLGSSVAPGSMVSKGAVLAPDFEALLAFYLGPLLASWGT